MNDDQDAGHSYDECIRGMEGIIRQVRNTNPSTDIVVTYFVNPKMLKQIQEGKNPLPMAAHEEVLEKYQISRVHLARELAQQINKGEFSWEKFGEPIRSVLQPSMRRHAPKTSRPGMGGPAI